MTNHGGEATIEITIILRKTIKQLYKISYDDITYNSLFDESPKFSSEIHVAR